MSKLFYGFIAVAITFLACKKEKSEEHALPPVTENQWEFKESDTSFGGPIDSAQLLSVSGLEELVITGATEDGKGEILLHLVATELKAGTYSNPQVLFQYAEDNAPLMQNIPDNVNEFSITIVSIDSVSVTGTFTGKVQNSRGEEKTITNGKFTAPLIHKTDEPEPVRYGELSVWSKSLCGNGGNVQVTVNGQTAEISQAHAAEPLCGAAGTAGFTLPVGPYTVKAVCGTDSAFYEILVSDNNCTLLEVDLDNPPVFTDYFPLTLGSSWVYESLAGTETVVSESDAVFESKQYRQFGSVSGRENYYRKGADDPNNYYEYLSLSFGGAVANAPTIEFIFLKDNLAEGESWQTPQQDLALPAGITVTAKLKSTIIATGFSEVLAGKNYDNLIEVYTELLVLDRLSGTFAPYSSYTTVYAKGIGKVYYTNPDDGSEWFLKSYALQP